MADIVAARKYAIPPQSAPWTGAGSTIRSGNAPPKRLASACHGRGCRHSVPTRGSISLPGAVPAVSDSGTCRRAAADVEAVIRPADCFRTKAESIRATCAILAADWGGIGAGGHGYPSPLPGVGRKVANLVRGDLYGQPGIVADTTASASAGGRFLAEGPRPGRTHPFPAHPTRGQSDFCHRIVQFGRDTCTARAPGVRGVSLAVILCARAKLP